GYSASWRRPLPEEFHRWHADLDCLVDFSVRVDQYLRARAFAYSPALREYFCERYDLRYFRQLALRRGSLGLEQDARPGCCARHFSSLDSTRFHCIAPAGGLHSGFYFHGAALGLSGDGHG